jgi:superfamily I DNA/RNA helicase
VIAGAGSGKSTTLVLRVVLMVCYLGIRPQDVTVVSFTRASCKELREKLCKVLSVSIWRQRLRPEDARFA